MFKQLLIALPLIIAMVSCKKGDDSVTPQTLTQTIPTVKKTAWTTQFDRDTAYTNRIAKITGVTLQSGTTTINSTWTYGLSDELVSYLLNDSGLTPGGVGKEEIPKVLVVFRGERFLLKDGTVCFFSIFKRLDKRTISVSFGRPYMTGSGGIKIYYRVLGQPSESSPDEDFYSTVFTY